MLAQEDLETTTSAALSAAYDLLIFPGGHHEYVDEAGTTPSRGSATTAVTPSPFLSANNLFLEH